MFLLSWQRPTSQPVEFEEVAVPVKTEQAPEEGSMGLDSAPNSEPTPEDMSPSSDDYEVRVLTPGPRILFVIYHRNQVSGKAGTITCNLKATSPLKFIGHQ